MPIDNNWIENQIPPADCAREQLCAALDYARFGCR
ncbi:hypothetical protein CGK74_17595, partial [Thauera propionica]